MLYNFGIEGESYTMENGYPKYTDLVMKNPQGLPIAQALAKYIRAINVGPFVGDRRVMEQYAALPEQKQSIEVWMNAENRKQLPVISLSADESSKYSSMMSDIQTFYEEKVTK